MFSEETQWTIIVRLNIFDHQQRMKMYINIFDGQFDLTAVLQSLLSSRHITRDGMLSYFDYNKNEYVLTQVDGCSVLPAGTVIHENVLILRCQQGQDVSDQVLANTPKPAEEEGRIKRSPQRMIKQAFVLVKKWRGFQEIGEDVAQQKLQKRKMNLDQSAAALNVPRKTLEDYYLLLRKGLHYNFDFRQNREGKIGVLRAYLRKHEEVEENENDGRGRLNQKKLFERLDMQIGLIQQQCLDIFFDSGSSDQQAIIRQH